MFVDRADAGRQLAQKLAPYRARDAVVLALPRGGVVVGYELARRLALPLDIVVTRKIGHPNDPEYAICAVDESGARLCDEAEIKTIDPEWLAQEAARQQAEAKRRSNTYRRSKSPLPLAGKTAIIADDGVATGLTMRLAIASVKRQRPARIVVAIPVAPADAIIDFNKEGADEVIVLEPPEEFMGAVGAHYEQFEQVEDGEVMRLLGTANQKLLDGYSPDYDGMRREV